MPQLLECLSERSVNSLAPLVERWRENERKRASRAYIKQAGHVGSTGAVIRPVKVAAVRKPDLNLREVK